jgi:hypothetical protein
MPQNYRVFIVSPSNQAGLLAVRQMNAGVLANALPGAPTAVRAVAAGAEPLLLVYDASSDTAQGYALSAAGVDTSPSAALKIGAGWNIVEPYTTGGVPCLLCYSASGGTFNFFRLTSPMGSPLTFSLTHSPGMSKGFTTVKPFQTPEGVYFLGYNKANGSVAIYSLGQPLSSPACVWSKQWAAGWTRFAFFQLGMENFFLKTNVPKPNVNIDRVLDDPADGTKEVGTHLQLDNALELTEVEPLYLGNSDPYFITYMPNGGATINRINGNCQGWTTCAKFVTVSNAMHVVPYQIGEQMFVAIL